MPPSTRRLPSKALSEESPALVLDQVTHGYVLLEEAVIELADAGRLASVAALLAERLGLLQDTIVRALQAQSEEPVTLLCRASGLGVNGFSAVLRMRRRQQPGEDDPARALAGFLEMPFDTARRIARMMKVNEDRGE